MLPARARAPVQFRPLRYRPVQPRLVIVRSGRQDPPPLSNMAPEAEAQPRRFVPDGMIYPPASATFFDATIRIPQLAAGTTSTQTVFTQEEGIKAGWIRGIGWEFSSPHAYFKVQTSILINGGAPSQYIFKQITAGTGAYSGSLPMFQMGSPVNPADVFISLPANALLEIRFVNNAADQAFSGWFRIKGWSFAN